VRPIGVVAVAGVTAIELNVALVTVKVPEPDLPLKVAVIVAVPADTPVATPVVDKTVATPVVSEVHATAVVMLRVVPSE
jgi:hypothetical protein